MIHHRTQEEMVQVRARAVELWNDDVDRTLTIAALAERLRLSTTALSDELRKAYEDGRTTRATSRAPSTRLSKTGRP